jgi:hypothetical protein
MQTLSHVISSGIYLAVGSVSAVMAGKTLLAKKVLPFHEEAAGRPWVELEPGVQSVILALMRVSGLGFLVTALLLLLLPVSTYVNDSRDVTLVLPAVALVFCLGLFFVNLQLRAKTGAQTPWKGALYAAVLLVVGMGLSMAKW